MPNKKPVKVKFCKYCDTETERLGNGWCAACKAAKKGSLTNTGGRKTPLTRARDAAIKKAGLDAVLELVAAGYSMREVANLIGLPNTTEAGQAVRSYLRSRHPAEYEAARQDSAEALEELSYEQYGDRAPATSGDAKWRNDKAGHLRWLADLRSGRNEKGAAVTLNIQELHLDALRQNGRPAWRQGQDVSRIPPIATEE